MRRSSYSEAYIEQFLREAYQEGGRGPYGLAKDRGLSAGQVYRWVQRLGKLRAVADRPRRPDDFSPKEKLRVVTEAARLDDAKLGEFMRCEGIQEADLERWREEALGGLSGPKPGAAPPSKRIRELERELRRKEKALAEAAALLVLAKMRNARDGFPPFRTRAVRAQLRSPVSTALNFPVTPR